MSIKTAFLFVAVATQASLVAVPAGVRADSGQRQGPGSQADDADYAVFANGGGKVHRLAVVEASAYVGAESKVGAYVAVGAGARIERSLLQGGSAGKPSRVGAGALVEGSTLQGLFEVGDGSRALFSMVQGEFKLVPGITMRSCMITVQAGQRAVFHEDISDRMQTIPPIRF